MTVQHPYKRIAETIRTQIRDGDLAEGARLPSIKELAEREGVATGTVRNAISWLVQEGFLFTSPRGTFVADAPPVAPTGYDRLTRSRRTGSILATGEYTAVTSAKLTRAPGYVAELFDMDPGAQVLRREFTTGKGIRRLGYAVSWYPPSFAEAVPELLSGGKRADSAVTLIKEATGREVKYGRDAMHGREASRHEANYLALRIGAPVLALVHEWSDDDGIIEYGEWVLPTLLTIGYEYKL